MTRYIALSFAAALAVFVGGAKADHNDGASQVLIVCNQPLSDTCWGTDDPDWIFGRSQGGSGVIETIAGKDGRDDIDAAGGKDVAYGGRGDDDVRGQDGDDKLYGGCGGGCEGGGAGNNELFGGNGNDTLGERNGVEGWVHCGPGLDEAFVDVELDHWDGDCETVTGT